MTLRELFNSEVDVADLFERARQGLNWWFDELAAMAPRILRDRLASRPALWIEADGEDWRLSRDGRPVALSPAVLARSRVGLLASSGSVFLRQVTLPRMPVSDLRRMVALDLDRLSPLSPDLVHFDLLVTDREPIGGRQAVTLALMLRTEAAALLNGARQAGYRPAALSVPSEAGEGPPRFDFLPQALASEGVARTNSAARGWRLAAVALVLVNLGVLVGRDVIDVQQLQAQVDAQTPTVQAVLRLRHRVEAEDAHRRGLIASGRRGDPLHVVDAVTRALPTGAWVQRFEWNGQTLRLIGYGRRGVEMATALRASGVLTNPRVLTSPATTGPTAFIPFDITADAGPEPRP
jgi:general secretion pathway protein L